MCVTESNYRDLINRLEQEVYPKLKKSLDDILEAEGGSLSVLFYKTIIVVKKELRSLETFERKLIFPAILSLVNEGGENSAFAPDVPEIINLTNIKEERLNKCVEKVADILQHEELLEEEDRKGVVKNLNEFKDFFYNNFSQQKKQWKELLLQLQGSLVQQENVNGQKAK